MPLNGIAVQNAALDAVVSSLPVGGTWRLYSGLPTDPLNELPAVGGYAPAATSLAHWAAAADAAKVATVNLGTSTDAYGDTATYWAWCDSSGVPALWDLLPAPLAVSAPGTPVSFSPALYFRESF